MDTIWKISFVQIRPMAYTLHFYVNWWYKIWLQYLEKPNRRSCCGAISRIGFKWIHTNLNFGEIEYPFNVRGFATAINVFNLVQKMALRLCVFGTYYDLNA